MKLLFLTSRFPYPLEKGDKLRSYFLLKELAEYHDIILVSLNEQKVRREHISELEKIVSKVYTFPLSRFSRYYHSALALFQNRPIQAGYFYNCRVKRKIHSIISNESPDHIFCQLLRTALYVKGLNQPKTIDYQDVFSFGVKRRIPKSSFPLNLVLGIEYKKLQKFEQEIFSWFDHHVIITETDQQLMPVREKDKIHVISNGVDFEYFDRQKYSFAEKRYDLLFTGNMGYPPNVDCAQFIARHLLPQLIPFFPDLKIAFAGANPHPSLIRMQNKHIHLTGWVEDMREYYASSRVFIAPMQIGTGLQNKLLEAMAMGLPCVTSELANAALGAEHGKQIMVGNTVPELTEYVKQMLTNSDFADEIAVNGHNFVKQTFSWSGQVENLNQIMNQ